MKPNNNYYLIDTKWIFIIKITETGELIKTQLVARSFLTKNCDLIYAHVVDIIVVRTTLAIPNNN